MRMFFKIVLFPISLLLSLLIAFTDFLVGWCAGILNILSGLVFMASLVCYSTYLFGWPAGNAGDAGTLQAALVTTVLAFVLSPHGLPMLAVWLLNMLDTLNDAIKSL